MKKEFEPVSILIRGNEKNKNETLKMEKKCHWAGGGQHGTCDGSQRFCVAVF